ncbi:MAG: sigma-54-dependent transcriptional regulator, partial [Candidatus Angelobacter sp.]
LKVRLLIVDDHPSIRRLCLTVGVSLGFECREAESAEAAMAFLENDSPDIVLADLMMPNMSGLEFLPRVKQLLPRTEIAIMTGHASIETAVQAMRLCAYDYITKPFRVEELKLLLQRMEEKIRLIAENQFLRERVSAEMELHGIVGSSTKIQDLLRMVARLKDTRTPVLITGESGTGKELVARAIHYRGPFANRPFVAVDCGSLVPTLIESELFGYEKGAFTGANRSREGLFQTAGGGTIFLDEIGELSMELQAKLLRVLQEKEVRPVGSNQKVKVDVRVVAATNRDLESAYREGTFRKDLFFRLNVVTLPMPPLRDRRSDIPALVYYFLDKLAHGRTVQVAPAAMKLMIQYDWPGNVRELENCIERAIALGSGDEILVRDLPPAVAGHQLFVHEIEDPPPRMPQPPLSSENDLEALERATIQRVFDQVKGDKAAALKMLGISRATLYRKLKRYSIGEKELSSERA